MCQRRVAKRPAEFDVLEKSEVKGILKEGAKILQIVPIPPFPDWTYTKGEPTFGVVYIPEYYHFADKKVENLEDPQEEEVKDDMQFGL